MATPTNQQAVEELFGQFKYQIMMLLNETADEFDDKLKTEEARKVYNDFTGTFGNKVLGLKINVD